MPKVTVLMPIYNGARFMNEAIDSVLGQTFTDFELLIIDDGSTDGTAEILRTYNDSRIRILRNESNKGESFSRNRGLQQGSGEYIAVLDADDVAFSYRLDRQVAYLDAHPEVGLVGSGGQWIAEDGTEKELRYAPIDHTILCWLLLFRNPMIHSSTMYRRELALKVGGYDESLAQAQDFMLWIKLANCAVITNLLYPLVKIRSNPASVSRANWITLHYCATWVVQKSLENLLDSAIDPEIARFLNYPTLYIQGKVHDPLVVARALAIYKRCLLVFASRNKITPVQCKVILTIALHDLTDMAYQCEKKRLLALWAALRFAIRYTPAQIFKRRFIRFAAHILAPVGVRRNVQR